MYTNVEKIKKIIDNIAPFDTQDTWDNSGLLIGNSNKLVSRVLLALDVNDAVVDEAIEGGFDLIITHHPLIFKGLKTITSEDRISRLVIKLIKHDIALIAAHTNVDRSFENGTNAHLAHLYKLENLMPLNEEGYGIIGFLNEAITWDTFVTQTKSIFKIPYIRTNGTTETNKNVKKIAICSGAASDFIKDAIHANCDVYVTSDLKYHEYQEAMDSNTLLVDVGHFESEQLYLDALQKHLENIAESKSYDLYFEKSIQEKPIIYTI